MWNPNMGNSECNKTFKLEEYLNKSGIYLGK